MISDREVTFFLALGELLADIEQPKRLIEKKLDAFRNPHRPQYDFGTWREDPFALPEEELAIWGIVSPYNMLRPEAQDRYMDLFTRVFHITREQLISKAINDVKLEVE